jgi:hypothetical protein
MAAVDEKPSFAVWALAVFIHATTIIAAWPVVAWIRIGRSYRAVKEAHYGRR